MKYEIRGGQFPVVICTLDPNESMITEGGSMVWMTPNMHMETSGGGLGKMFSKAFSGESMFQNRYTATGGPGMIAFGSSFPGKIMAIQLAPGQQMIVDTGNVAGFEPSVQIEIQQVPGLKNKMLGGEGFFNTVLTGPGRIWLQTMPISGVASAIQPYIVTS